MHRSSDGGRVATFKDKDSGHFSKGLTEPQAQQTDTNLLGFQGDEWTWGWEGPPRPTMGQMARPILLT